MLKNYLSGVKACVLPVKLGPYATDALKKQIENCGGELCDTQSNATIILTALTSPTRIKRHITNYEIPIVNVKWLKDCKKNHERLPIDSYIVQTSVYDTNNTSSTTTTTATDQAKYKETVTADDSVTATTTTNTELLNRRYATMPPDPLIVDDADDLVETPGEDTKDRGSKAIPSPSSSSSGLAPGFINTKYECLRPTPLKPYHNRKLVALLRLLERKRELDLEDKNALSYRHAIAAIKAYPRELSSSEEARKINGIGKKISMLTQVYLDTGTILEAEKLLGDERFRTISLFVKVFGVGPKTANLWYDQGHRTLQQILDDKNTKLVKAVRLGIQLLPDFDQLMNRQDVQEIVAIIEKELALVDKHAIATPVGGYRRGKDQNGDLDIVIASRKLEHGTDQLLKRIVEHMTERGYIRHVLLMSDKNTNHFGNHYTSGGGDLEKLDTCFVAFMQPSKKIMRQVDFIVASLEDYPTALLGWTGSRQFERALRDYAKKEKGLSVKSHGIYKDTTRKRIKVESEKHAFELIGIPWLEPEMRNC